MKKEGSIYDLPMVIGILIANEEIKGTDLSDTAFIGELSLDGKVNKVSGVFPIALEASKLGIKKIILPKENAKEASIVQDIQVIGVETLKEVVKYLNGEKELETEKFGLTDILWDGSGYEMDFKDVKGQEDVKRALEVAAARWA